MEKIKLDKVFYVISNGMIYLFTDPNRAFSYSEAEWLINAEIEFDVNGIEITAKRAPVCENYGDMPVEKALLGSWVFDHEKDTKLVGIFQKRVVLKREVYHKNKYTDFHVKSNCKYVLRQD